MCRGKAETKKPKGKNRREMRFLEGRTRNRLRRAERGLSQPQRFNDPVQTRFIWRAPTAIERGCG